MIGIYKISSPSNKVYIGQSTNIENRWKYFYKTLRCKSQPKLYNSFLKYGFKQHKFEVIEECTVEQLNEREIYWGSVYNVLIEGLNCKLGEGKGACSKETKQKMSKDEIIRLLSATANMMEEQEDLSDYINSLDWNKGQDAEKLRHGYFIFKTEKIDAALAKIAKANGLQTHDLLFFVNDIMSRLIFDGEKLTDLLEPLELNWKERSVKEQALMTDLIPLLKKQAQGREISGLTAYE